MVDDNHKTLETITLDNIDDTLFLCGIGMWHLFLDQKDPQKNRVSVNKSFQSILGDENEEPTFFSLEDFTKRWLHPDELEEFINGLNDLIEGHTDHFVLEHRLWSRSRKEWRWANLNSDILKTDTELQTMTLVGIIQDIHNSRQTKKALTQALIDKESTSRALNLEQKRLSAVIEAASLGTWDWDIPAGTVVYNPLWAATIGYDLSELNQTVEDRLKFILPSDLEVANKAVHDHCSGLTPSYEADYRMKCKNGSIVWAHDRGRVVEYDENGKPKRLLGVMIDVTRQKKIEQALAEGQEQMELFFKAANFGAWDWDLINNKLSYNQIFYEMLGYNQGELQGSIEEWEEMIHPDDLAGAKMSMEAALVDNDLYAKELRLKRRDGEFLWTYDIGRVVERGDDGLALRMVGGHFDFSEKKKMEQDFIKMMDQEKEAHLARELAEESARSKSEFLANMSHEIRTPMNAILGLTHLVLETDLNDQQLEYLQRIEVAAKALLRIINDILDFSKIEAGKLEMEETDFNLDNLLQNALKLLSEQAQKKSLELTLNLSEQIPVNLVGDPIRLGQIINNLLSNAIKFTEKGEINVIVKLEELANNRVQLCFSVKDSGIGLNPEQRRNLFNAFTQADNSITRKYGGTGLGLTISKRLSEMMGGRIWCESQPGLGSTFSFTARFPISQKIQDPKEASNISFKDLKALAVDDNTTALEILKRALVKEEFTVTTVSSGTEALDYIKSIEDNTLPDLILVDWKMDGMDGIETIRRMNSLITPRKASAVIMVTAYNRDEVLNQSREVGIKTVLTKPLSPSSLHDSLMDIFGSPQKESKKARRKMVAGQEKELVQSIKGASILLVEDNDVNQLVASRILSNAGLNVKIASNGKIAVDMIQEETFELVLMDIQMPEMDGLTATKLIREMGYKDLPIVAMTAHAMSTDRDLSLQAGMNDHISKPINVTELFQTLLKWIPPHTQDSFLENDNKTDN